MAGGIIMMIGLSIARVGQVAWMFELHEVSKYKQVSFNGMLSYLFKGIDKNEVQRAKDDYYRSYNYPPPQPKPVVRKKVPQSHLCPRCRSKILPGDELCLSCGEPLN
jgi:hypothetical protein